MTQPVGNIDIDISNICAILEDQLQAGTHIWLFHINHPSICCYHVYLN